MKRQVKPAKFVTGERVRPHLKDNRTGSIEINDALNDLLKVNTGTMGKAEPLAGLKTEWNDSSRIPSRIGTFTAYPLPRFIPMSYGTQFQPVGHWPGEATHSYIASTREELAESMKARRHHPVRGVEGLFDAIAMMDINVDV